MRVEPLTDALWPAFDELMADSGEPRRRPGGARGRAAARARAAGAPAVEADPLDGAVSPSSTSTGYASTFVRAGFREIARRSPERPVMRLVWG
ncbi:hypothetical protein [Jiangella endophytica]|uniref:hypothetical protein n=1 Tax=Jiangella endophytica TaxID=1623398 RepID=UPI0013008D2E|nr:hypothetical protein [Jiangella endophytica]